MQLPSEEAQPSPRLGEVVEASSTEFTVHCYELYGGAPLGTLVRTDDADQVFAVVRNVTTVPIDPARRPVPRGQGEPDREAVYRSNPQLEKLLHTQFQATIVGYRSEDGIRQYLPPLPPPIHTFVEPCGAEDVRDFVQRLEFLPLLLLGSVPLADEVTAAFLRLAATAHPDPDAFLTTAGREVARLLGRDLQRANGLLRRLAP